MNGLFKVRIKGFKRWFVFRRLPNEAIYDEWLYLDRRGVPTMYWSRQLGSVILFG